MRWLIGTAAMVGVGSLLIAGYNAFLEQWVPDVNLIAVKKKTADGAEVAVPYLTLDDVARVGVVLLASVPIAMSVHKMLPSIIPAPTVKSV